MTFQRPTVAAPALGALAAALVALAPACAAEGEGLKTRSDWEGAAGLMLSNGPAYVGASDRDTKLVPVFFLRWGRISITNSSGFVPRRSNEEIERGLGIDLSRSDTTRIKLSLRYDNGRSENDSPALKGLGDARRTIRVRLSAQKVLDEHWRVGAAWSFDALARGGGNFGDIGAQYDTPLARTTVLSLSASLTAAGDRYMQTYHGVSEAQSARSGYPVYEPKAGLRDLQLGVSVRHQIDDHWFSTGGLTFTRVLGPAADSPITFSRSGWRANVGAAYRF